MLELDTGYTFSQVPYLTYEVLEESICKTGLFTSATRTIW